MAEANVRLQDAVESVTLASAPEEATAWIRQSQNTSARNYYFNPYIEDSPYQRLYIYQMSEVVKYSDMYGYEVPEDKTEFYLESMIPTWEVMDYVGEP